MTARPTKGNAGISAIVLAAGLSRRAAPHNKLLLPVPGGTVVRATVAAMCAAEFWEVIVVTGHQRREIEDALAGLGVRFVFAAEYARGMGHSLAAGVRAARKSAIGFAFAPGDLPELNSIVVRKVASRFFALDGRFHVIPVASGHRGHPVIVGAWLRSVLENATGDIGARLVLADPQEVARCDYFDLADRAISRDVDRPGDHVGW